MKVTCTGSLRLLGFAAAMCSASLVIKIVGNTGWRTLKGRA